MAGIFSPTSPQTSCIVQEIAEKLKIPFVQYNWKPTKFYRDPSLAPEVSVNFYPDQDILAEGIATVVKHLEWKHYAILYENSGSVIRLQEVMKLGEEYGERICIRDLDPEGEYR